MLDMSPPATTPFRYTLERVLYLAQLLLLPPLLTHLLLHTTPTPTPLPLLPRLPLYPLSILLYVYARSALTTARRAREMGQLNARAVPVVRGRWPGNIDVLLRMMKAFARGAYVLQVYRELFDEYGCRTLNLRILGRDQIITMDESVMKYVLATGFDHFSRGKYQKERMESFLGSGIFNRDGAVWRHHRATARPFFARERVSDLSTYERFSAQTLALIDRVQSTSDDNANGNGDADGNAPVEVQDLYARFTLDAAGVFLFGREMRTLEGALPTPAPASHCPPPSPPPSRADTPAPAPAPASLAPGRTVQHAASAELLRAESGGTPTPTPAPAVASHRSPQSTTPDAFNAFAASFGHAQEIVTRRARQGYFWPLFEFTSALVRGLKCAFRGEGRGKLGRALWEAGDASLEAQRGIRAWLDPLVADVVREKQARVADQIGARAMGGVVAGVHVDSDAEKAKEGRETTFLQHLADTTDDPAEIRDELLSILLASRDTTACLLTFATYLLALHPHVAARLRAEVIAQCGADGQPTFESLRNLSYMRAVLNETLRLFPPVPLNVRESRNEPVAIPVPPSYTTAHPSATQSKSNSKSKSTSLALAPGPDAIAERDTRPLYMPPNTIVMYFPLLIHRDPHLWGADADAFDPERWIDPARLAMFTRNPIMFTPFSAGPRICIGQTYALTEASYFLVRLFQKFDTLTLAPDAHPPSARPPRAWREAGRRGRQCVEECWPAAAMTLFAKGGLWVRFGKSGAGKS